MPTEKDILELPPLPFCRGCAARDRMIHGLAVEVDKRLDEIKRWKQLSRNALQEARQHHQLRRAIHTVITSVK